MTDVVFEEESKEIEKDREIATVRDNDYVAARIPKKATVGQNLMMILFALVCCFAAYGVWHFKDGFYSPAPTLYKEDVDSAHLKLIPEFDQEKYINSLPSKK
jgi:hypothetical protein